MKTKASTGLVALMKVKKELGNVDIYSSSDFDYVAAMSEIDTAIEIMKSYVVLDHYLIEHRK